jgi:hypothetical protein
VRYVSLAEALVVAEAVTDLDLTTLPRSPRIDLLDSALHAPQASFSGQSSTRVSSKEPRYPRCGPGPPGTHICEVVEPAVGGR